MKFVERKEDLQMLGFLGGTAALGGAISWLCGAPWWVTLIVATLSPVLVIVLVLIFFIIVINAAIGG